MERNSMNLKSMSIDQLVALREQVSETLGARVTDQRRALEAELSKLTRFQAGSASSKSGSRRGAKAPVAPKYRNPENPSETWAGRGLRPRWLSAAIKMGKKVDDFLIPSVVTPPPKVTPRKKMARAAM
jgi:DNA-binding protein H-NS